MDKPKYFKFDSRPKCGKTFMVLEFSELALEERIEQMIKDFAPVRERVQRAIDASPNAVTLEEAMKQIESFGFGKVKKK